MLKLILPILIVLGTSLAHAETPVTLGLTKGGNPQGFITASSPTAIKFATNQGTAGNVVPLTAIKGTGLDKQIIFKDRQESLRQGRSHFARRDYLSAAKEFAAVVERHDAILNVPQNFASEAMFYQIESLRRLGRYEIIASLLNSPAGQSMSKVLGKRYEEPIKMIEIWAVFGANDWDSLESKLSQFYNSSGSDSLPAPSFKKMSPSKIAQLAFMRGQWFEQQGKKDLALKDYSRAFSFNFGNEESLTKKAMASAMNLMSEDPRLNSENKNAQKAANGQIQSVAYFFSKRFPDSSIPSQFLAFTEAPKIVAIAAPQAEPEAAPEKKKEEMEKGSEPKVPANILARFKQLDANKDGKLTKKEWQQSPSAKKMKQKQLDSIFKRRDKNKDKFLSVEEMNAK